MFARDLHLKPAHEKSAEYFETTVIHQEFNALNPTQKNAINIKMSAHVDSTALCGDNTTQKRARDLFFNFFQPPPNSKRVKTGPQLSIKIGPSRRNESKLTNPNPNPKNVTVP